jgi:hypothetical protein
MIVPGYGRISNSHGLDSKQAVGNWLWSQIEEEVSVNARRDLALVGISTFA